MSAPGAAISGRAARIILFELLAPFIAGHTLQPLIGGRVGRHRQLLSLVDRRLILLVVYDVFSARLSMAVGRGFPRAS
ncbi:bile acid:sodium symporter [Bradyrhizobium sp. 193]|nr:bile acid:sodium symporter [Bradyrhizobium sp. 193]